MPGHPSGSPTPPPERDTTAPSRTPSAHDLELPVTRVLAVGDHFVLNRLLIDALHREVPDGLDVTELTPAVARSSRSAESLR